MGTLAGATGVAVAALLDTILRLCEKGSTRLGRSLIGMQYFTNFGDNEQNAMLIPIVLSQEPAESYGDDAQGDEPFWAHQSYYTQTTVTALNIYGSALAHHTCGTQAAA